MYGKSIFEKLKRYCHFTNLSRHLVPISELLHNNQRYLIMNISHFSGHLSFHKKFQYFVCLLLIFVLLQKLSLLHIQSVTIVIRNEVFRTHSNISKRVFPQKQLRFPSCKLFSKITPFQIMDWILNAPLVLSFKIY